MANNEVSTESKRRPAVVEALTGHPRVFKKNGCNYTWNHKYCSEHKTVFAKEKGSTPRGVAWDTNNAALKTEIIFLQLHDPGIQNTVLQQ